MFFVDFLLKQEYNKSIENYYFPFTMEVLIWQMITLFKLIF